MLQSNVQVTHTYRFRSTAGTASTITAEDVLGIAGAVCTTANSTLHLIAAAAKIHRVSIWSPPPSQGSVATCSLAWLDEYNNAKEVKEVSDTTMSTAVPAYLTTSPPQGSQAYHWISAGASNSMKITAPTGSVIDIHCTHTLYDAATNSETYSVASGTVGALYYLPLDGSSDVFLPVGLQTTT